MSNLIEFPVKQKESECSVKTYNLFDSLSSHLGVDMHRIVFEKDDSEKRKLDRLLLKRTMVKHTRRINIH